MVADGSGLRLLIEDGFWADWSPDGSQIAFASAGGNVEIYVANSDGTGQRRLTARRGWTTSLPGRRMATASHSPRWKSSRSTSSMRTAATSSY